MKHFGMALALVLLAGCSSTKEVPVQQVQIVKVPVTMPCKVDLPKQPVYAFDAAQVADRLFTQVSALVAEILQRQAYIEQLEAAVRVCTTVPDVPAR